MLMKLREVFKPKGINDYCRGRGHTSVHKYSESRDQEVEQTEIRKAGGSAETLWSSLYRMVNAQPTYFDCDSFAITSILYVLDSWRLGSFRLSTILKDKD